MVWDKLLLACCAALLSAAGGSALAKDPVRCADGTEASVCGDGTIKADVSGSVLEIKTSTRMGGAIESLTWKGKEFINSSDHGRLMQSASSFNRLGECYNPTEAGSAYDARGKSSSRLTAFSAEGNRLTSTNHPAYWRNCLRDSNRPSSARAANDQAGQPLLQSVGGSRDRSKASDHTFSKDITIGFRGHPNIIVYKVTFGVPDSFRFTEAVFEPLTAYMPTSTVSQSFAYSPAGYDGKGECAWPEMCRFPDKMPKGRAQTRPIIVSSPDGEYAMGVYTPDIKYTEDYDRNSTSHYTIISNDGILKWNVASVRQNPGQGEYSYTIYVIVGSKEQVKDDIDFLYAELK
ncbi:hypothetical protein ACFW16_02130 [Inquilinus sp. NPDC058860]|uniref:hypothetical protein n=1 Tax=Inquilinus sp. NPDC058860 TaxID=3346652 RepID=UPI0036741514